MEGEEKYTCVSHSTTEAEVIALDIALRVNVPALAFWEVVVNRSLQKKNKGSNNTKNMSNKHNATVPASPDCQKLSAARPQRQAIVNELASCDYVPCTMPPSTGEAVLYLL